MKDSWIGWTDSSRLPLGGASAERHWPVRRELTRISRLGLLSGLAGLGLAAQALAKAVGWAAELDDLAVMRETVDQRAAEQGIA